MRLAFLLFPALALACTGSYTGSPCTATVGATGRNYSTIALAIADLPANLVTDGNSYVLNLYNDAAFTSAVSLSGHTTDSTHFVTITAAPGQSFQDGAVRGRALTVNQGNGVAISLNLTFTTAVSIADQYTVFSRIQVKNTGAAGAQIGISVTGANSTIKDCIVDVIGGSGNSFGAIALGAAAKVINTVAIQRSNGSGISLTANGSSIIGSTVLKPSNLGGSNTGIFYSFGGATVTSTGVFGFSAAAGGSGGSTISGASTGNATDISSASCGTCLGTTGNTFSVTYSAVTPFTQAASTSTLDFRAIAATSLVAAGVKDATNAPNDISNAPRPASPTVGAWEVNPVLNGRRRWYGQ